ncbi:MAG: tRNA adenosine(34) deaminase TadA [Mariprofundales bacterium]
MQLALVEAQHAASIGEVPVGAVVQLADGRRFSAHNAPISSTDVTAHAEIRALRAACAASNNYRLVGASLTVTLEPCLMCCGAIIHARIAEVIIGACDTKTGAAQSLYQTLSDDRLNHQPKITTGIFAEACSQLLRDFFRQRRQQSQSNGATLRP